MSQAIKFYNKNLIDIDDADASITITDSTATDNGQSYVNFMRNRKNTSAWVTTGSNDAANTQIDIDMVSERIIDRIIIVGHNLKAFTIQYYNGSTYVDFSTAISETTNSDYTTEFAFTQVSTTAIRIIITGTQSANDDKYIYQLIVTKSIGQLNGWPEIKKPEISLNKKVTTMLSGKKYISRQTESFSCTLSVKSWNNSSDLSIIESIYFAVQGVLIWINAGDDTQFNHLLKGYRSQDIFLVSPIDEYSPEYYKYCYQLGIKTQMKLEEVVR